MDDATMRKKRGRKPLDPNGGPAVPVNLRMPSKLFDALREQAQRDGVTVPEVIRRAMRDDDDAA